MSWSFRSKPSITRRLRLWWLLLRWRRQGSPTLTVRTDDQVFPPFRIQIGSEILTVVKQLEPRTWGILRGRR